MEKELKKITNYILNVNNIPMKGLKRSPRRKVYLFGKAGLTDIDFTEDNVSILLMSNDGYYRELMHIYHDFNEDSENELKITVNKTLEISELPFFSEKDIHTFKIKVDRESFEIIDELNNKIVL